MMEPNDWRDFGGVIAAISVGFWAVWREFWVGRPARMRRIEDALKRIERRMDRIESVETHLEDVLNHPDDSGFGVGDLVERLDRIERELRR